MFIFPATGEIGYSWILIRDSSVDLKLDEGGVLLKPAVEVVYMAGPDVGIGLRTSISVILGAKIFGDEEDSIRFFDYGLVLTWKI